MKRNKIIPLIIMCLVFCTISNYCKAQKKCDCDALIKEARYFLKDKSIKEYKKALNKFNSAKACSPRRAAEIDNMIEKLFREINGKLTAANEDKKNIRARARRDSMESLAKLQKLGDFTRTLKRMAGKNLSKDEKELITTLMGILKEPTTRNKHEKIQQDSLDEIYANIIASTTRNENLRSAQDTMKKTLALLNKNPDNQSSTRDSLTGSSVGPIKNIVADASIYRAKNRSIIRMVSITLDSIAKLDLNKAGVYNPDKIYLLDMRLNDSISRDSELISKKSYFTLLNEIKEKQENKTSIGEDLIFSYIRSAYFYSWALIDANQNDEAAKVLDNTEESKLMQRLPVRERYYCMAGFENARRYIFDDKNDYVNGYEHAQKSILYARTAVAAEPYNFSYLRALAVFINNTTDDMPESIITTAEKLAYSDIACNAAGIANPLNNKGFALNVTLSCVNDQVKSLVNAGRLLDADSTLKHAIKDFTYYLTTNPSRYSIYLLRAQLYLSASGVYLKLADTTARKLYINKSFDDFIAYINHNTILYSDVSILKNTYNNMVDTLDAAYSHEIVDRYDKTMSEAMDHLEPQYKKQTNIATVMFYLNNYIAHRILTKNTAADSIGATVYYDRAIDAFERGKLLNQYIEFSESFVTFVTPNVKRLEINIKQKDYQKIVDGYNIINHQFSPVYRKYPFDFYLGKYIKQANSLYGEYLYQNKQYVKAIPALERASDAGDKTSTGYLALIYTMKRFADTAKANMYKTRNSYLSGEEKIYSFNAHSGKTAKTIDIYFVDRPKIESFPYRGIEDQAKWWRVARQDTISTDVVDYFNRIQDVAWKYNTSFKSLALYVIKDEKKKAVLAKYDTVKSKINEQANLNEKLKLAETLSRMYNDGMQNDTVNSDVIKKDAVDFYAKFAEKLAKDKKQLIALDFYKKILLIDPENDTIKEPKAKLEFGFYKKTLKAHIHQFDLNELGLFMDFCTQGREDKQAALVIIAAMQARLDKSYANRNKLDATSKVSTSVLYNNLAWDCLLLDIPKNTVDYLQKAIALNPLDTYSRGNLPHAYLLTNQFETARKMYLEYMDRKFDADRTYKDVFLNDLENFKKHKVQNKNIQKMIDILSGK